MLLSNYTTADDVRAALGVSEDELRDEVLLLKLYEDRLASDLEDISVDLSSTYMQILGQGVSSEKEERFLRYTRLFATYSVSRAMTASLPMFGPKTLEDGKSKMERFQDPYKDTIKSVNFEFDKWKDRASAAFSALSLTSSAITKTPRTYFSIINPANNPITGT